MAMWLKQAVLVLLTVAEAAMVGNSREIILKSGNLSSREPLNTSARSLTFTCRVPTEGDRYRVTFSFKDANTKDNSLNCGSICGNSNTSTTKQEQMNQTHPYMKCTCTTWEIHNVTSANNGFYSCEIKTEIPMLSTKKSMEVEVIIEGSSVESTTLSRRTETQVPAENNPSSSLWLLWLLLGLSFLIVVIVMVLCVIVRRVCFRNRDDPDPVYANTYARNKERSHRPAPGPDQLKLAEPYQNLRTPSPSRRYEEGKRRLRP